MAYDALADEMCTGIGLYVHELKYNFPYYELMWEVNPKATEHLIESFWSAHILDWSNLDMNRHGSMDENLKRAWKHNYEGGPVFFVTNCPLHILLTTLGFDTGTDLGDNYGGRVHGWLYVPATGDYTFWLCTDDQGELWLSADDDASNVELIASESTWSAPNTWGSGEEQSNPIPLVGGNKYYIMALWKEGEGGDQCQVAWRGPAFPTRTIIPGTNLSPYEPVNAFGPSPGNRATNVTQRPVLGWKPGIQASSHRVYFGTDEDAVKNATTASPEYKGTRALGSESFDPGKLAWESTYYWRIDEVNNVNPDSPWIGSVWSFTTASFLIIDDFEGYTIAFNKNRAGIVIWQDGVENCVVQNNIFYKNGGVNGILFYSQQNRRHPVRNNIFYPPGENLISSEKDAYEAIDNQQADPRFVDSDSFDFHLKADSPAIDAGTAESAPKMDFEAKRRPQGGKVDIGAYEATPITIKGATVLNSSSFWVTKSMRKERHLNDNSFLSYTKPDLFNANTGIRNCPE